jgi:UV DNA damage repair endonuclease
MVKQNRNVMSFVDVLAHPCILRRRAARNRPAEIEIEAKQKERAIEKLREEWLPNRSITYY